MIILSAAAAMIVPMVMSMSGASSAVRKNPSRQSLGQALSEAARHRGYILLVVGFYVCGLHVQFIATHLPNFLSNSGLGAGIAATAIAVIGLFGTRYMATLYGIVFLSHQLGSFTGVWLGAVIRDATGSNDAFWWVTVVFGLIAALIHWPIDVRPVARLAEESG